jgi:hypothetical protein
MPSNYCKANLKSAFAAIIFLLPATVSFAQSVAVTATRQTTALPDGNTVPMWGWACGAVVAPAACTGMNGLAQTAGTAWQPPLITVPLPSGATTASLSITLTNNLPVETSLTIVGQPGGGLGIPVRESGPRTDGAHQEQTQTTWTTVTPGTFMPPAQGARVRSFVPEATPGTGTQTYTWTALKPGTYLIESGTYPSIQGPMGLYGVLVVYTPGAAGGSALGPGTAYSGTAATSTAPTGTAYSINYDASVPLLLSEIDPAQNTAVEQFLETSAGCPAATPGTGACTGSISAAAATTKWTPACGTAHTCYPAAVNYAPMYYLINGKSFDRTAMASSSAPIAAAATSGRVLLRFVNAGSHMHVPSVNGLQMSLIAEDGNVLPDVAIGATRTPQSLDVRVQSEVFLPAGKAYDVMVSPASNATATTAPSLFTAANYHVYSRDLSLSTDGARDGGMRTILQVAGGAAATPAAMATVNNSTYYCTPGVSLVVADPGKGVVANAVNVYGVRLAGNPSNNTLASFGGGSLTLNPNGTFVYTQPATNTTCGGTFTFYANGNTTLVGSATISPSPTLTQKPVANNDTYASNIASLLRVAAPGVLGNDTDPNHYPLCAAPAGATSCPATPQTISAGGATISLKPDGSFTATLASPPRTGTVTATFTYVAVNSEKSVSNPATVTLSFQAGSGLVVNVQDARTKAAVSDYKWIIEQDRTFHIDPACQQNGTGGTKPAYCPPGLPPTLGTNFHASYMPVVAVGCTGPQSCERDQTVYDPATGRHVPAVCDGGICAPAGTGAAAYLPTTSPGDVNLPTTDANGNPVYYYVSVLPGDAANSFNTGNSLDPTVAKNCVASTTPTGQSIPSNCGHTMGGAPITPLCTSSGTGTAVACTLPATVTVNVEPNPLPTSTVTVFVFEDDWPLNGEPDAGGGPDTYPVHEVGLEDFNVALWDDAGGSGDPTGQMTYDMFNMPLTNSLNGMIDPVTGFDACPISNANGSAPPVGVIVTCPKYESDGVTPSPLTGQAVIKNLMPGRFGIIVHPGAKREANGEEWLQTNTLDGTHFLDSFVKMAEPAYFQEFGPGGYHVFMGMANPKIINSRLSQMCTASVTNPAPPACNNTIHGQVASLHQARSPNEQLHSSAVFPHGDPRNYAPLSHTTCYAALGDSDAATFAFAKCDQDGNFTFTGIPDGTWGLVVFDQWLDLLVDGSSKGINVSGGQNLDLTYATFTWQTHLWSNTYLDLNGNGIRDPGEPGLLQIPARVRMRNGKFNNSLLTNIDGNAHFDETFPLFNWYVTESDNTRFRNTGVHVVNDAGGQVDGPTSGGYTPGNGNTGAYQGILNSKEAFPVPANLRVPGAVYCGTAECTDANLGNMPNGGGPGGSTGRVDPGSVVTEGWQGGVGEFDVIDWGKLPYAPGETGGIRGHVVYNSTRPFDDPTLLFQNLWEPLVPGVAINLYKEGTGPDGTQTLTLVDTTTTSSWDNWAQGFNAVTGLPNMSCPGQDPADPFFGYTLAGTPNHLASTTALPNNSQYKCYDGFHNLNQIQPAPYDGLYQFPSPFCAAHAGGTFTAPSGQTINCATVGNPALSAPVHTGAAAAVLPPGKYVVEEVTPPNYEIVKEEDKNILIGDGFIAPVTQQFGAITNIFIVPDQATVNNANSCYGTGGGCMNPTTNMGRTSIGGFGPGGLMVMPAPCVGQSRIVPDFMSASPEGGEVAPFAGALRNLCDRKEVTLEDQMQAQTDFFIWTKTPAASHFTGFITDDLASEFDPNSPAFGEKFSVTNVPVAIKDYNGVEVSRVYSDQWGIYNGMVFSTWQVNPPNPTGYSPGMMITCMNDPGPIAGPTPGSLITDPNYNPNYSNFCYENPFMPQDTTYLDTPVVPTAAFADGYNPPDCNYPDGTPAILRVDGDGPGPWVSAPGHTLTITALGNQVVPNHAYSGPAASTFPYNQKFITRHYGFGSTTGQVHIDGALATVTSWSDSSIQVVVPTTEFGHCILQQVGQHHAECGELQITTANGQSSIDTVTVTVGGKPPAYVNGENASNDAIQTAIDAATPGDLIIVNGGFAPASGAASATACAGATVPTAACVPMAAAYNEMILMWKPVRLQGVGAPSVVVNANAHPAGKLLQPWRRKVNCLFGLSVNSGFISPTNPYDATGTYQCAFGSFTGYTVPAGGLTYQTLVDPIPLESVLGWTATMNGNIIEMLQEPTLMGAYEGAAITVLAKGLENNNTTNCSALNATQSGCIYLNAMTGTVPNNGYNNGLGDCNPASMFYATNFLCNPSRIDGMSFTNSSQGGGGIFVHGYGNNLEVSNNRSYNNGGTIGGGIVVGNTESPSASFNQSVASVTITTPGSGYTTPPTVTFAPPIPTGRLVGTTATGVATIGNVVGAITLVAAGSGYKTTDTVAISGGGGTGATAVIAAVSATGAITTITLTNPGIGYSPTSPPTVSFVSATGTGATATATVNVGGVSSVTVTNPGAIYTSAPAIAFAGGGGTGAAATANLTTPIVQIPFFLNTDVYVHHNWVTGNVAYGDELNSTTPAGSGGVIFCDGSDYYDFQYNWVCGNLSTGDGGGVGHFGFSYNGDISYNWILFNQSSNPTLTVHGGGLVVMGLGPDGITGCGEITDTECPPQITDGVGPGLVINGNVIMGNTAESGSGGGIRLQHVNGTDVQRSPNISSNWYQVNITNNVIANNVAGFAGGGVSLHNAVRVNFNNNTVVSNDTTSSAGVLFDTSGASFSTVPPPGCDPNSPPSASNNCSNTVITQSNFMPAGLETEMHDATLLTAFTVPTVNCGEEHPHCTTFSTPSMHNNIFWQNRSFRITTGTVPTAPGLQSTVQLVPALTQSTSGSCPAGANYWDIGVYGDTGPTDHSSKLTLHPTGSILSSGGYAGSNSSANPGFVAQYCNGSRVPPEIAPQLCTGATGSNANAAGCIQPGTVGVSMTVPTGIPDINQYYPAFTLAPAATVDEGNNWINMFYGPLSLSNTTQYTAAGTALPPLGNYNHNGDGAVASIFVTNPGSGYTSAPQVTLSAPLATGTGATAINATAVATISNVVGAITVAAGGSGYTTADSIVISGGGGTGASAEIAAVSATGAITSIRMTSFGSGYTSAPSISFTSAAGTGANATATVTSGVTAVTVTNPGNLYTSSPTVTFTGGGGAGAAAAAEISTVGASPYAPASIPPGAIRSFALR